MKRLRWLFNVITAIILLVFSLSARGADSPQATIQAAVQEILTVLQDSAYQGPARHRERLAKAEEVILCNFDKEEFAREALGRYWSQRTAAEQHEFVGLFTALVARTYVDDIDRRAKDVKVFYDEERVDGTDAEVDTRVFSPSEHQPVSVNYMMHQGSGRWLIYDVQVDDVSMALNYRSQFSDVLNNSSYADLIQRIKSKLQELQAIAQAERTPPIAA
jgi:phospholipid transport system substrate-binding protein